MCDYPIHTKLSDLISDDESDENSNIKQRIKINFTESSSKTIDYKANLTSQVKSKNLITVPSTSLLHTTHGKTCYDLTCDNTDKDSLDGKDDLDCNSNNPQKASKSKVNKGEVQDKEQSAKHSSKNVQEYSKSKVNEELNDSDQDHSEDHKSSNIQKASKANKDLNDSDKKNQSEDHKSSNTAQKFPKADKELNDSDYKDQSEDHSSSNIQEAPKTNTELNDCDNQEQSDSTMSKRFGLLFQKGVRTKTEKEQLPPTPEADIESVLPNLKSSKKADYAESSFIEVKEDHYSAGEKKETIPAQSAPTSDDSELGTRADPIGESRDVNMAAAMSETDCNKDSKGCDQETKPDVKETVTFEKSKDPTSSSDTDVANISEQNGDTKVDSKDPASGEQAPSKDVSDDRNTCVAEEKPPLTRRSKSDVSNHTISEKDSDSDSNEQNETKADSATNHEVKTKKKPKTLVKKDPLGARPTRSSLLRSISISNSDPSTRKINRAESISSDESDRTYRSNQPPPSLDPVPDGNSDFKPNEHWQSLKESQKVDAKNKVIAKKEFSDKYRKHGLPKRAPSFHESDAPKHHASTMSLASVSTVTKDKTTKKFLKPEFNPFGSPNDKYLTPLQQKEKMIHDLQKYVSKLEETINLQGDEIANFQDEKEEALHFLATEKDVEMDEIYQEVKKLEMEKDEIIDQLKKTEEALEEEKETVANLQGKIAKMEIDGEEREEMHKRNYFQMYQKGREAQLIEQEEDIVCHTLKNPGNAPNKQLATRLEKTEKQLDKLRQTFRNDTYNKGPQLENNSEAQVELLKSAVFYFLTDCQPDINLRTMLSMLNYSEVQKKNIYRHLTKKKN